MRLTLKLTLGFLLLLSSLGLRAQTYSFSDKSNVGVESEDYSGGFSTVTGTFIFDEMNLSNARFDIVIDVRSLKLKVPGMAKHALSADYFDAKQFPSIFFSGTEFKKTETGYSVSGTMKVKGIEQLVVIPFSLLSKDGQISTINAEFNINRNDYGVGSPESVSDVIAIKAQLVATNKK